MEIDGLLPVVGEDELAWLAPQMEGVHGVADAVMGELVRWVADLGQTMEVVWPAALDGELVAPPDAHVVDTLVRRVVADSEEFYADPANFTRPQAGTVSVLDELPGCDLCAEEGVERPARYDSPDTGVAQRLMTYMCAEHYSGRGTGRLGVSEGSFLMADSEVSPRAREAVHRARQYWSARGVGWGDADDDADDDF